jgi:hypothetical protein
LRQVRGWLEVLRNASLTSLSGLDGLESTQGLSIATCPRLTSLRALTSVSRIDGALSVIDNVRLPTCEATWLRDNGATIAGEIAITGNDDTGVCR